MWVLYGDSLVEGKMESTEESQQPKASSFISELVAAPHDSPPKIKRFAFFMLKRISGINWP